MADVDQLGVLVGLVDDRGPGPVEDDLAGGGGGDPVGPADGEHAAGDDQGLVIGQGDELVGGPLAVAGEADDQRGGGGVVGVADDHLQVVLVVPGGDGVGGELLALMAIPSA